MPRGIRVVAPGAPHHVILRGNRRQDVFVDSATRRTFLRLLTEACERHAVRCLAWCLMTNHIHLILVPETGDGLRAVMASVKTAYAQRLNRQLATTGHVFEGRFYSRAMDDAHMMVAVRYVENNPVDAGLVNAAEDWAWSSARAHIVGVSEGLTDVEALRPHVADWRTMLRDGLEAG